MAKANGRKKTPAKRPAAKRAPRPKKPAAAPPAQSAASEKAVEADATKRIPAEGDRAIYCNPRGSLQEAVIVKAEEDGSAHIAIGSGRELRGVQRAKGAQPEPGEWQLA